MAISFPSSPSTDDVYLYNGVKYIYDGTKWVSGGQSFQDANFAQTSGDTFTGNVEIGTGIDLNTDGTADFTGAVTSGNTTLNVSGFDVNISDGTDNCLQYIAGTGLFVGNDGSNNNLALGSNIALNDSGSATFSGTVRAGGDPNNGANTGTSLYSSGEIVASHSSSTSPVFLGYTTGNSTETTMINADGTATFSGRIRGDQYVSSNGVHLYMGVKPNDKSDNFGFVVTDATTGNLVGGIKTDGGAEFTSTVRSGGDPNDGGAVGTKMTATGVVQATRSSGASAVFMGYTQGTTTATSRIDADGDATFAGYVESDLFSVSRSASAGKNSFSSKLSTSDSGKHFIGKDTAGSTVCRIDANGSIIAGAYDLASSTVAGTQVNQGGVVRVQRATSSGANAAVWQGYTGTSNTSTITAGGALTISGALSKGSGSFRIDHPLKPETHQLVHSFVEGPQADNIYRGKVDLVDGAASVNIDTVAGMTEGTFVALNREIQCFTTNETGWTAIRGSVEGNILTIEAQDPECTDTISWLVIGERQDQHMYDTEWTDENGKVIVEPEKVAD